MKVIIENKLVKSCSKEGSQSKLAFSFPPSIKHTTWETIRQNIPSFPMSINQATSHPIALKAKKEYGV